LGSLQFLKIFGGFSMATSLRNLILTIVTGLFAVTLFSAIFRLKELITPGISEIYNFLGPQIAPNMVTLVVFDWRGYDTLGEALILVTAVVIVLLIFGRGIVEGDDE
jgi:energy-converting hydrogenase B subunit H